MKAALLLSLAILITGCLSSGTPDEQDPPSADPDQDPKGVENRTSAPSLKESTTQRNDTLPLKPWLRHLDWQTCNQHAITSYTLASLRQQSLPANYSAAGPTSDLTLKVYQCEAVVVDNRTVVPATLAAFLLTSVVVESSVEQTSAHEYYMYAMWSNNETLADQYRNVGVNRSFVTTGFDIEPGPAFTLRINVQGTPAIDVQGSPDSGEATATAWSAQERFFFGSGDYTWVDTRHNFTAQVQPYLRPVFIEYHPAWLQDIAGLPTSMTYAEASHLQATHIEHAFRRL